MDAPANLAKKLDLPAARENPEYAQALAKKAVLRERLGSLNARIGELQTRISIAAMPLDKGEFADRVAQAVASEVRSFEPMLDIASARLELSKLKNDREVITAALREQTQTCERIRDTVSAKALTKIEAEHKRAVAAIAQALDDLRAAALTERDIHRQFHEAGYSAELPSFRVPRVNFFARDWGVADYAARLGEYLR